MCSDTSGAAVSIDTKYRCMCSVGPGRFQGAVLECFDIPDASSEWSSNSLCVLRWCP